MRQYELTGKWALVTGAGSGMGRTTSIELAREGARLILVDINGGALGDVARELEAMGTEVQTFCVDITDFDQVKRMADTIHARQGAVDVLVNNAGVAYMGHVVDTGIEDWRRLFDVNMWSIVHMVNAFAPQMMKRKSGRIVNVSSGQAFFAVPTWGAYAATKFWVNGYSESLRYELYWHGVGVTAVYPGIVRTPFYDRITGGPLVKAAMKMLMATASRPETVSRLTVKGIKRGKRMVIPALMWPVYVFKPVFPHVYELAGRAVAWALRKESSIKP